LNDPTVNSVVSTNCTALVGALVCDPQCLAIRFLPATFFNPNFDCTQSPPVMYPFQAGTTGCTSCYIPPLPSNNGGLSPGAIAGITFACIGGVLLVAAGVYCCRRRKSNEDETYLLARK